MAFKITEFLTNMNTYGKSSPNRFEVSIVVPNIMNEMVNEGNLNIPLINIFRDTNLRFMTYRADAVNIPGIDIMSIDSNNLGVGPKIKQTYNVVLSDVIITFINDDQGILESFFNLWMNLIYNFGEDNDGTNKPSYLANYRSDICSSVSIMKYDDQGNLINKYTLINAMPTLVSQMEFSWENRNTLSKFRVKFDYTNFAVN